MNKINQAIKTDDNELFQSAFSDYTDMLQEAVLAEARGFIQASDNTVLVGRVFNLTGFCVPIPINTFLPIP